MDAVLPCPVPLAEFECSLSALQPSRIQGTPTAITPQLSIDCGARTLWVDGREATISAQKFDLLCYLVDRAGIAVQASDLVREGLLRPSQAQRYKGLIQELKSRLGSARDLIRVVPGYGYRLDIPGENRRGLATPAFHDSD